MAAGRRIVSAAWRLDGTSASVCVAVLAALDRLRGAPIDPASLARRAHAVETRRLAQQSGIQDQWAAAAGGVNLIEMGTIPLRTGRRCAHTRTIGALDAQLLVVVLPRGHDSSAVHAQVAEALAACGPRDERLEAFRALRARRCRGALAGDFARYGVVLTRNTGSRRGCTLPW